MELTLVLILAFLVLRSQDLKELARLLGKILALWRSYRTRLEKMWSDLL